jgi:hypothetical protein
MGFSEISIPSVGQFGTDLRSRLLEKIRAEIRGVSPEELETTEAKRERMRTLVKGRGSTQPSSVPSDHYPGKDVAEGPHVRPPKLFLYNVETGERIALQTVPNELAYSVNPNWVSLTPMGRNNPLYHYTGSEDSLSLTLDWYSEEENREDVIRKCKHIESWSKNDGYDNPPPRVKLLWGNSYLNQATWVISDCEYKLSNFHYSYNMLPQQAYQKLTLLRVTETNLNWSSIISIDN